MADTLNKSQKEAVAYTDGPLLIVAGAGTGKTTVITQKIAHIVNSGLAKPEEILALTFTDKSAEEMQNRIESLLDISYVDMQISTFHSFCQRVIENYGLDIGISNQPKLLTEVDAWILIRQNLAKFNLRYYQPLGNPTKYIHELINHFSKCKDEMISPEDYLSYAESIKLDKDRVDSSEKERLEEIANAYHVYNQILLDNNAMDFSDLIYYTVKLLESRANVLKKMQDRYKYILVDEFQDVNWSQYRLVRLLAGDRGNLTVVGDDDQCLLGDSVVSTPKGGKKIKNIKTGEKVYSAVGKGLYSTACVSKVKKVRKSARFAKIKLESGKILTVTDNHIMFCHTPQKSDQKYYYVYLMQKKDWGWRMGITNDLSVRLRLERGADRIIAIRGCNTEAEARYYETIYSLRYNIPTVCFKARGLQNKDWLQSIFEAIDTNSNVEKLASELKIDLNAHHYCLNGVSRGSQRRLKINLTMCYRNNTTKYAKAGQLKSPFVSHLLHIETSDRKALDILKREGVRVSKAKKGWRARLANTDLAYLENMAKKLSVATDGIIERSFVAGRTAFNKSVPSYLMPAKNLQVGLYLPTLEVKKGIIQDRIIEIKYFEKTAYVYDLEVEKTHNFVANNVVVHNSIYAFRGASVSNIMRFKDDYAGAKEIVLNENYRSGQEILDASYHSIKNNDPDRLEVKLNIDKKLISKVKTEGIVRHLHFGKSEDEVESVVAEIMALKKQDEDAVWDDFAILVRANSSAEPFVQALESAKIPYEHLASRGLFRQPIVIDCINYFKLLDNYHEPTAIYRLLKLPFWDFSEDDLQKFLTIAKRKSIPYYEALKYPAKLLLSPAGVNICAKLASLIDEGVKKSRFESPSLVLFNFLDKSGYLKYLAHHENIGTRDVIRQIYQLRQFLDYIAKYEQNVSEASVSNFMEHFLQIREAGDDGQLYIPTDTPDSVNVMTIHASKGMEFKYVFIVNMVEQKFPSRVKSSGIEVPVALVKEQLPEGDIHYQEERRLFYVAVTRAKTKLYFTSADNYGGKMKRKISRFLTEIGVEKEEKNNLPAESIVPNKKASKENNEKTEFVYELPKTFSFSQIKSYKTCPYQYKLSSIVKLPMKNSHYFTFGNTIHNTLQDFYNQVRTMNMSTQGSLFGQKKSATKEKGVQAPSLEQLLQMYEKNWSDDWFLNKKQREDYYADGKRMLKQFYKDNESNWTIPVSIEGGFKLKVGKYTLSGRIDRIDQLADGSLEIIDYKTGNSMEKAVGDDKDQLLIYQMVTETMPQYRNLGKTSKLTYYFLKDAIRTDFIGSPDDLEKLEEKVEKVIDQIHQRDFTATPNKHICGSCSYRDICEFRV